MPDLILFEELFLCVCRDAITSCDSEEFVKEAAEVPNFLEEVEECRKFQAAASVSSSGELSTESERERGRDESIELEEQKDKNTSAAWHLISSE